MRPASVTATSQACRSTSPTRLTCRSTTRAFDGCRIDRVLQHIADPAAAIGEMVRVLRPGGVLVAFDNDWETLTVDSADRALTRTVLNAWCDRFPSGWIGRRLVALFLHAGLGDVVTYPKTLVLRDLDVADRIFSFFRPSNGWRRPGLSVAMTPTAGRTSCEPPTRTGASSARTPGSWYPESVPAPRRARHSDRDVQAGVFLPQASGHDHGRAHRLLRESAFAAV